MSNQVTGRVHIFFNGVKLPSKHGAVLKFGGVERTPICDAFGVVGHSEKMTPPEVRCVIAHNREFDLAFYTKLTGATLIFSTDTGVVHQFYGAFCLGGLELANGEVEIRFSAPTPQEPPFRPQPQMFIDP